MIELTVLLALQVLHPAVDPLLGDKDVISPPSDRWSIVVLGRIFEGRQSKGHELATQLFKKVQAGVQQWGLQGELKLLLMGNPMPGQVRLPLDRTVIMDFILYTTDII
jgi:hypothetical protein